MSYVIGMKYITDLRFITIEKRASKATPGPWSWWTSNSFRRLSSDPSGKDGDVLYGDIQRSDGHPDVVAKQEDMDFIAGAREDVPFLCAAVRMLQSEKERLSAALEYIEYNEKNGIALVARALAAASEELEGAKNKEP